MPVLCVMVAKALVMLTARTLVAPSRVPAPMASVVLAEPRLKAVPRCRMNPPRSTVPCVITSVPVALVNVTFEASVTPPPPVLFTCTVPAKLSCGAFTSVLTPPASTTKLPVACERLLPVPEKSMLPYTVTVSVPVVCSSPAAPTLALMLPVPNRPGLTPTVRALFAVDKIPLVSTRLLATISGPAEVTVLTPPAAIAMS